MKQDWNYWKDEFRKEKIEEIELRIHMADGADSPIEKIVALFLPELYNDYPIGKTKIRQQVKIERYTVDFLVTFQHDEFSQFEDIKVVIECDGHDFHEKTKEQAAKDKRRDRQMTLDGYHILRYTGSEIVDDPIRIYLDVRDLFRKLGV